MTDRRRVVVIGAGLGGIAAAKALRNAPVDVLVIDRNNYQTFQPLLYQVASATLEPGEVAHHVRGVLRRQRNADFRQGTVWSVDWDNEQVHLTDGNRIPFDDLVLAAGTVPNDFGIPGVARYALFLKSLPDAITLRAHVLAQFESANADPSLIDKGALRFVVVGDGPAGVEIAGALSELIDGALEGEYPNVDTSRAEVVLIEMQGAPLPMYGARAGLYLPCARQAGRATRVRRERRRTASGRGRARQWSRHRVPHVGLGRGRPRAPARRGAGRRADARLSRRRERRPERPDSPASLRRRRSCGRERCVGNPLPATRAGRDPAGPARGAPDRTTRAGPRDDAVPIPGQGHDGDHRAWRRRGRTLQALPRPAPAWRGGLARLAGRARRVPAQRPRAARHPAGWTYGSLTHDHPVRLITSMEPLSVPRAVDGERFLPTAPETTPVGPALNGSE